MPLQSAAAECRCRVPLQGAAAECRCRVPLQGAAAGCRCRVPLQSAAAECRCGVPLVPLQSRVPLQSAAVECRCKTLLSECCLRFELCCLCRPLQGAAVKSLFALWSLVACAVRCKVLLSKCCLRFGAWLLVPLQGAPAGCCLQGAVLLSQEIDCGCRFRVPLQGAAALECCPRIFFCYLGSLLP